MLTHDAYVIDAYGLTVNVIKYYLILGSIFNVLIIDVWSWCYHYTKVGCSSLAKSLWDLKSEMSSLHFSDFTLVKVIYYNITM